MSFMYFTEKCIIFEQQLSCRRTTSKTFSKTTKEIPLVVYGYNRNAKNLNHKGPTSISKVPNWLFNLVSFSFNVHDVQCSKYSHVLKILSIGNLVLFCNGWYKLRSIIFRVLQLVLEHCIDRSVNYQGCKKH